MRPVVPTTGLAATFSMTRLVIWLPPALMLAVSGLMRVMGLLRTLLNSPFKSEAVRISPGFHTLTRARAMVTLVPLAQLWYLDSMKRHQPGTHTTPEYQRSWRKKNLARARAYDAKRRKTRRYREYMAQWRAGNKRRTRGHVLKTKFG